MAAIALSGCTSSPKPPPDQPMQLSGSGAAESMEPAPAPQPPEAPVVVPNAPASDPGGEPGPIIPVVVRLTVLHVMVPSRLVSSSEAFWKHVDEHAVDPAAYDMLYKNGIRAGLASQSDWDYFRDLLTDYHAVTQPSSATSLRPSTMEIPLKNKQFEQAIFWYDGDGFLSGKRYDYCDDYLSIFFTPTPRHPGDVSVSVVPLLRSTRQRLEYTQLENEIPHFEQVFPEYLFDLRLRAVIGADHFLVIAPSPMAFKTPTLGAAMLLQSGGGEQFESLLVISPTSVRLEPPATHPAGDSGKP